MELPLHFNRKSNSHIWMSVFLNSLICPLPYILILRHSHTVLITVASVSWKSSNFAILCLKFLNTQGPLHFHKILESTDQFLPKKKNSTAIFIGIESYLNINYELFIFQQCWSFQSMNKASLSSHSWHLRVKGKPGRKGRKTILGRCGLCGANGMGLAMI